MPSGTSIRFVNVRVDKVAVPGGHVEREVVEESSDGVLIVPLTDDGRVVLVEQSRQSCEVDVAARWQRYSA